MMYGDTYSGMGKGLCGIQDGVDEFSSWFARHSIKNNGILLRVLASLPIRGGWQRSPVITILDLFVFVDICYLWSLFRSAEYVSSDRVPGIWCTIVGSE